MYQAARSITRPLFLKEKIFVRRARILDLSISLEGRRIRDEIVRGDAEEKKQLTRSVRTEGPR